MKKDGTGMTMTDLQQLPEVKNVCLWQNEDGPSVIIDDDGVKWVLGFYMGKLSKRRFGGV